LKSGLHVHLRGLLQRLFCKRHGLDYEQNKHLRTITVLVSLQREGGKNVSLVLPILLFESVAKIWNPFALSAFSI
jgi:hypothetical protein